MSGYLECSNCRCTYIKLGWDGRKIILAVRWLRKGDGEAMNETDRVKELLDQFKHKALNIMNSEFERNEILTIVERLERERNQLQGELAHKVNAAWLKRNYKPVKCTCNANTTDATNFCSLHDSIPIPEDLL